ncbi:hypothetical protein HPB52_009230 [Rhipicephalus sanguineus]|uniref:RRM domain-containing protein n=1 Tax=Rhipicephalus sanguineus TaxID=34632 RepID=A0A9D4PIP0_RHISA|nr:hypothetical protein HPB52_009230 [Rhipicephalus sanguineus]
MSTRRNTSGVDLTSRGLTWKSGIVKLTIVNRAGVVDLAPLSLGCLTCFDITELTTDSSTPQATAIMAASPKRVRSADAKKERSRERTKKSRTASTSSSRSSSAARSASGARGGGGDAGSGSKTTNATSSSSSRRKRTPTPPRPCKIHVGRLTRNVTRDHLLEIFGCYGAVKSVELPPDRTHSHLSRGFAYIEFENPADAERAMRHMDGDRWPRGNGGIGPAAATCASTAAQPAHAPETTPCTAPALAEVTPAKVTSAKVTSTQRAFRPKSSVKPAPLAKTIASITVSGWHGRRTQAPRTFKLELLTLTVTSVSSKVLIHWHHL